MKSRIIHGSQLTEVIRDKVKNAFIAEHLETSEMVEFYVVNLLQEFHNAEGLVMIRGRAAIEKPLSVMLLEALNGSTSDQIRCLKRVGDLALVVSGFFGDSLHRGLMRPSYYISIGETAYGSLACIHEKDGAFFEIYLELTKKFAGFARVISTVAPWNDARSDAEVLKIYERWIMTGDNTLRQVLEQKGILEPGANA
jgi:hypothetical protein